MCNFAPMKKFFAKKEYIIILIAWIFVYAMAPLCVWYVDMLNGFEFNLGRVHGMWMTITMFLLLYILHHFILVPKLFVTKRYAVYAIAVCMCTALCTLIQVNSRPKPIGKRERFHVSHDMRHHDRHDRPYNHGLSDNHDRHGGHWMKPHRPHEILLPHDVACIVMLLLMFGVDIGTIAWMNSQKLQRQLLLLERQNLEQELDHLRYQINPHFFMNTLNNIHVLVDVDQERAKRAIIELSGLMRHSLYNSHESLTLLQNEIEFIRQYISLMELRFGKRVELVTNLPDAPSHDIMIPPLLFATFVENAFKHGISYQHPSFIHISLSVDSESKEIHFRCENSRNDTSATHDGYHGIGLDNVRKRLNLQYAENYSLNIHDEDPDKYIVDLILPIQNQC